jgi:hypothetical protein
MTSLELYAIYLRVYVEAARGFAAGGPARSAAATQQWSTLSPIERTVAQLAVDDATNGTTMRALARFMRALEEGAAALRPLGLRNDCSDGGAAS